ncbi:hypothetical protein ACWD4O_46220 [Streptomyces sp. NPDC002623]
MFGVEFIGVPAGTAAIGEVGAGGFGGEQGVGDAGRAVEDGGELHHRAGHATGVLIGLLDGDVPQGGKRAIGEAAAHGRCEPVQGQPPVGEQLPVAGDGAGRVVVEVGGCP